MYYSTTHQSPIGALTIASDGEHIIGLWIENQKYYGEHISDKIVVNDSLPIFASAKNWLNRYFAGQKPLPSELPLAPMGNEFRLLVWNELCRIPYGEVTTYGAIAQRVAQIQHKTTFSAQAVGGAVGHNPISIIIPCHRVVGASGSLTGFAAGIETKKMLLELEKKSSAVK